MSGKGNTPELRREPNRHEGVSADVASSIPTADCSVRELLTALASDDASPGAGAAAAVTLALAAACARKAVAISLKHQPGHAALIRAGEQLDAITRRALRGADEDARQFETFLRQQDAHTAEKLARAEIKMLQLARELLDAMAEVERHIALVVAGDMVAAVALCRAVLTIEAENLDESLRDNP
jgi:formiminotetrahydrofolate cyclodeaminase